MGEGKIEDKIIERIQCGDSEAIEDLVQMYYSDILQYCILHTADWHTAEDATQETFLKVIRYLDQYVHKGKFRSFLYKIAKNTCIDIGKKKNITNIQPGQSIYELTCNEQGYEDIQENLQLQQLVKGLPEKMQEIVILRFSQELTMREIADIVNLPMRTVQSQLRLALKILKKEMGEKDRE